MSVAANQQRTFLRLLAQVRPHWHRDPALPNIIQSLLTRERRFGSRDRRLYRELLYTAIRYLPWIEPLLDTDPPEAVRQIAWLAADLPATQAFRAEFAVGTPPAGDLAGLFPPWFRAHCPALFQPVELATQLRRAPLWLRLQTDSADEARVFDEFSARGWAYRRSALLPDAVEVLTEADVTQTDSWREGLVEVQDLGSQMILAAVGISPGEHWLDACAGAGGKTLQLARVLGAGGRIVAHDVRARALEELQSRAARAGIDCTTTGDGRLVSNEGARPHPTARRSARSTAATIRVTRTVPTGPFDGVLVDAPCSGSGTWRRAPHLKWTTSEDAVMRAAATQRTLLAAFSQNVRPGGRLIYATCSLSSRENEDVVAAFLDAHPGFMPEPFARTFDAEPRGAGLLILPSRHDTDGFFVASLRRR